MSDTKKPGVWTRVKWFLLGKPVSHDEAQAARGETKLDPMVHVQNSMRGINGRSGGL
ncbi:hypothetical protein ACIQLJ_14330 [Microbacterium sp. NPDC091313]